MFNKLMAYAVSQNVPIYLCENVMCRLCGCTGNNTSYILLKESCYLVKMIKDETQIRIKEEDVYPKTVCRGCVDKIHMIEHFRSHCKKTQKVLESMFSANNNCQNQTNMIALHSVNKENMGCEQINSNMNQINTEIPNVNLDSLSINTAVNQMNIKTENDIKVVHADLEDETMEVEWLEDEFNTFQNELNQNNIVPEHNTESTNTGSSSKYAVIYGDSTTFRSIHVSLLENELSKNATVVPPKILGQMKKKRVEVVPKEELSKLTTKSKRGPQSKRTRNKISESNDNLECSGLEHVTGQYDNVYVKINDANSNTPLLFRLLSDNTSNIPTEQYHDTQGGRVIDCSAMENLNFTVTANNELVYKHSQLELIPSEHDINTATETGINNNNTIIETYIVQNHEELPCDKQYETAEKQTEIHEYQEEIMNYESKLPEVKLNQHEMDENQIETCKTEPGVAKNPSSIGELEICKEELIVDSQVDIEDNILETLDDQQIEVNQAETNLNQSEADTNHLEQNTNRLQTDTNHLKRTTNRRGRKYTRGSKFKRRPWRTFELKRELSTDIVTPDMRMDRSGRVFKSVAHKYVEQRSPLEYQCMICEKTFRYPFKAELHVRRHIGEKPFMCKQCGKSFITGFYLMKHERTHAISQYICEVSKTIYV